MKITEEIIKKLKPGQKRSHSSEKGDPTLIIKCRNDGNRDFYLRYRINGKDKSKKIGRHISSYANGITLKKAKELAKNFPTFSVKKHNVETFKNTQSDTEENNTFSDLLSLYINNLYSTKKRSAKSVENSIKIHIRIHQDICQLKASKIEPEHIQYILAVMDEEGIKREINKVRAYMHAAFEISKFLDYDARNLKNQLSRFKIKYNPVKMVPKIK
jgi:hypothetical protein